MLGLVRAAALPAPRTNVRIGPYEVDAMWNEQRVIVEVDGYAFHSSRAAFERDRARDADLQARGFRVVRVTWRQIVDRPEATVARIACLLGPS
jgi:very-short-patch-repair endonuclease